MQELDDTALLCEYVERDSEEAFATLVARHVNKVYSVALRHTGNPHQAEEITQAVFVILARKSRHLGRRVILSGWLYQTARLTALTFIRGEIRRARREQEAHMQTVLNESESDVWTQIAPLLDAAMAGLNETDRHAVVLRFFDGKSMKDVGAALGGSENAAKMRINRAVEKLQAFFVKRGIDSTTDTIVGAISANAVQAAPVLLAKTATAIALAKGAVASGSILTLAKATLIAMKTKTIVATIAATTVILGTGAYLVYQSAATHASSASSDGVSIKFANDAFKQDGDSDGRFLVEVDSNTRRTTNSAPALHIKGPVPPASPVALLLTAARNPKQYSDNSSSLHYSVTNGSPLFGQHIRVTGWLKTSNAQNWVGAFVIILGKNSLHLAYDDMSDRPIRGTTDWQQVELVTDLPNEPCVVYFGPDLYGPGELWGDDFQIALAPRDAPITDSRTWRCIGETYAMNYAEATDYQNVHDGHPTVCLTYTPPGAAPNGSWTMWSQTIYVPDIDNYRGRTVRMSGWVKTENVSERLEPILQSYIGWYKLIAWGSMVNDYSLKGTRDWTPFSVTCVIPKETEYLRTGFTFHGSGKVWIDMDLLKFEIVK